MTRRAPFYQWLSELRELERVERPSTSTSATWVCPNPHCRHWTRPSKAATPGTCDRCGTPKPAM